MSAKRDAWAEERMRGWNMGLLVLSLIFCLAGVGLAARAAGQGTASISGKIVIKGEVTDPRYRYVEVNAYNQNINEMEIIRIDSGEFHIGGLQPGIYTLRFAAPTIREKIIRRVQAPSKGLEVELETMAIPRLKIQAVDSATSAPIQIYRARVRKVGTLSGPNYLQKFEWTDVREAQGRTELEVVGPGIYQVEVAAGGRAWTWSREINSDKDAQKTTVIGLGRGGTLHGRVVDAAGRPVAGAGVIPMTKAGLRIRGGASAEDLKECATTTTQSGEFTLEQIAAGTERLRVAHRDYCSTNSAAFTVAEGRTTTAGLEITLRRGGAIAGRVFDEKGAPQPGITLNITSRESDLGEDSDWHIGLLATVVSDAQGRYRAEHLPEAICEVMRKEPWKEFGVISRQVIPAEGTTCTLDLGGPCRVTGRVLRTDGEPWAGAKVFIDDDDACYHQEFWATGRTDEDGRFSVAGLMPGRRGIYVETDPQRAKTVRVGTAEVSPGEAASGTGIDLGDLAPPKGRVTIEFQCADPKVIRNMSSAYVVRDEENGHPMGSLAVGESTRRDATSPVVVKGLEPGRYLALAQLNTFLTVRRPFTLKRGEKEAKVRLHLPSGGGMLDGFHTIKDGPPLVLATPDHSVIAKVMVEREHYMIDGLPAGKYQLFKMLGALLEPVCDVALLEGEPVTLDISGPEWERRLRFDLGRIDVQTMTAAGIPLSGVKMWLERNGKRFTPLPPGRSEATFVVAEPGEYLLKGERAGYRPLTCAVRLRSMAELEGKRVEYTRVVLDEAPIMK